jgi:hypothetical protein
MGLHPCAGGPEVCRIKIYRAVENGLKREKINEDTGSSFFSEILICDGGAVSKNQAGLEFQGQN